MLGCLEAPLGCEMPQACCFLGSHEKKQINPVFLSPVI